MNCIIIDDEPLARLELEALIKDVSNVEILGKFSSPIKALEFLNNNAVDLIFLDIEMPLINGFDFAKKLPKDILIIFTTAYEQYALKSYDYLTIDYLLKPVDATRVERAINRAQEYIALKNNNKQSLDLNIAEEILIKSNRRTYKININEILYIEGLKDYIIIHTIEQKLITASNLKTFSNKIPEQQFIRVSKSFIVNIKKVTSFTAQSIYINEIEIPMGEVYKQNFLDVYTHNSDNIS